jgi:hypothetical protein
MTSLQGKGMHQQMSKLQQRASLVATLAPSNLFDLGMAHF